MTEELFINACIGWTMGIIIGFIGIAICLVILWILKHM